MKEKIYTIPVNEAFSADCECPICLLEKKLEKEAVDYALGAAMMEPDYRLLSNDMGYCTRHYSMLIKQPNKLSLSLVLDTHLEETRKKLNELKKDVDSLSNEKGSFFKKSNSEAVDIIHGKLKKAEKSCVICDKIKNTSDRYIDVVFYLWKNDDTFRQKLTSGKGFCIPHFNTLCTSAFKYLDRKHAAEFVSIVYEKEIKELNRIQEDIHKFTLKFDYRNKDMELGTAVDSPIRTIEKVTGFLPDE